MTIRQEIAYTGGVTWKDYLKPKERAELDSVAEAKAAAVKRYNAVWRKLKARCDARVRRDKEQDRAEIRDND